MNDASTCLDGRLKIVIDQQEMRMSHWVESPRVLDARSGEVFLDLHGTPWHLDRVSERPDGIALELRKYPGSSPSVELVLTFGQPGGILGGKSYDRPGLLAALDAYS